MNDSLTQINSIAVYVCTHERNPLLKRLLNSLKVAAAEVQPSCRVAVVVIDDNPDGRAKEVVESFGSGFDLGIHYRHSGAKNISIARNLGVETAIELGDWVAMTDDDQTVSKEWLASLIKAANEFDADAVTGPVFVRYGDNAPSYLKDQPFEVIAETQERHDGEKVDTCSTGNSMIRSAWLKQHNETRFREDLGITGGEDMVFFRTAIQQGLKAYYSTSAKAYQIQEGERATFKYVLRCTYWLGNSESLTNLEVKNASRIRLLLRGTKRLGRALARSPLRVTRRQPAQWRFSLASFFEALGMLAGAVGVKAKHQ